MSQEPEAAQVSPGKKNRLSFNPGTISVIAVLVMVFVMGLVKIYSADLGFHLKSAETIIKTKRFIYTDSFSYGSAGRKYYDLQWLFQLLVYFLYNLGQPVLVIVNSLLISFSFVLTWFRFSRYPANAPSGIRTAVFAVILFLFALTLTFEIRPHVLSWIYLNLLLFALESYKRGKQKAIFFLPVIMLFWVNTHSLAILGLVTIGIYNAGLLLERKKIDKILLLFSCCALAAFLINPYFIDGLLFPFKQFGFISGTGNGLAKAYIGEMNSPFAANEIETAARHFLDSPLLLLQYLSPVVALVCLVRAVFQKNFTDVLLFIAFLALLNLGFKNYGYFLMVIIPLTARYITDWLVQRRAARQAGTQEQPPKGKRKEPVVAVTPAFNKTYKGIAIVTACMALLISITCINDGYTIYLQLQDRFGFTEDTSQLPVEASAFLTRNHIRGKMLNHFNFGGYLMAHTDSKVFIDGRIELIDDDFFRNYYSSVNEENSVKNLLDTFKPDIVIFPFDGGSAWWQYFLTHKGSSGYKPVYFDGLSVIYLQSSAYPQVPELTAQNVLKDLDVSSIRKLDSLLRLPVKPYGTSVWLHSLWQKQVLPIDDMKKAIFCFANGFDSAALVYSAKSLERTTVHNNLIYTNLSVYYQQNKRYDEVQLCESKIKEEDNIE